LLLTIAASPTMPPPSEFQPLQLPLGATCQMCQQAPSPPRAKISSRPSALRPGTGVLVMPPPSEAQPPQKLLGAVC